jgi:hypothetical protein
MKLCSRLIAVLFAAAGLAPSVQAAGLHFELQGLVPAFGGSVDVAGYGSQGLYLGDSWGNKNHAYTNWSWDTVGMDIASNGDAVISGSMTRGDGYDTGASKAVVVERPIPEPGAALVFGLACC